MTLAQDQLEEARQIAAALADEVASEDEELARRLRALVSTLTEIAGHTFVKGALAVPFTAAVKRAAREAMQAREGGDRPALRPAIGAFEGAISRLRQKTSGAGGLAIT